MVAGACILLCGTTLSGCNVSASAAEGFPFPAFLLGGDSIFGHCARHDDLERHCLSLPSRSSSWNQLLPDSSVVRLAAYGWTHSGFGCKEVRPIASGSLRALFADLRGKPTVVSALFASPSDKGSASRACAESASDCVPLGGAVDLWRAGSGVDFVFGFGLSRLATKLDL